MRLRRFTYSMVIFFGVFFIEGCATYYQKSRSTEQAIIVGNYKEAQKDLDNSRFLKKKRNKLLYFLEMGKVNQLINQFEESNRYFNQADDLMDEYRNLFELAVGVTINASIQPYRAEPYEQILIHYYKGLNYLQLNDIEGALVEARRLNLKQEKLNVASKGKENKYNQDPFGLILMGMIYEAGHDFNNAFIAYRNANEVYTNDKTGLFHNKKPSSLELAIARNASKSGISYNSIGPHDNYAPNGELILFWEEGLAPVKQEENLFFALNKNNNGDYFFVSGDIIIMANYDFGANDPEFRASDLGLIRVAYPRFVSRAQLTKTAELTVNNISKKMDVGISITEVAFQHQKDLFIKQMAKDLLRLTLKKISEQALISKNELAGFALNITNTLTEKADTRNWQTLPNQIQYTRIPLAKGENMVELTTSQGQSIKLKVEGNGRMIFRNLVTY